MIRQFTATVYLFQEGKILLGWHAKHARFMPPGGHLEPNETPVEAALRETWEETGLEIDLFDDDNCPISTTTASSIPRPYKVLLEKIPPSAQEDAHEHIDFIFLGSPKEKAPPEVLGHRWFSWEELSKLDETKVFPEIKTLCQPFLLPRQVNIEAKPPFPSVFTPR